MASDVVLPHCHWWSCAVVVGGRRQPTAAVAVGDSGDVGQWCQVSWMVVGRKRLLIIDDAKLSVGVCRCPIWPWPSENSTYRGQLLHFQWSYGTVVEMILSSRT